MIILRIRIPADSSRTPHEVLRPVHSSLILFIGGRLELADFRLIESFVAFLLLITLGQLEDYRLPDDLIY